MQNFDEKKSNADLREVIRFKAENHSSFYNNLCKCSKGQNENHNEKLDKSFFKSASHLNTSDDEVVNVDAGDEEENDKEKDNHEKKKSYQLNTMERATTTTTRPTIKMCERRCDKMSSSTSVCLDCSNGREFNNNISNNNDKNKIENNNFNRSRLSILSPPRQRKTGVFNCNFTENSIDNTVTKFPSVDELIKMYASIIKQNDNEVRQLTSNNLNLNHNNLNNNNNISNSTDSLVNNININNNNHKNKKDLAELSDVIKLNKKSLNNSDNKMKDECKTILSDANNTTAPATAPPPSRITAEDIKSENEDLRRSKLNQSPGSDDGWCAQQSPYCSSDEEDGKFKNRDKVTRSSSSDSALGLEEDIAQTALQLSRKARRMTLTVCDIPLRPALLPLAEPSSLQGSCEVLPSSDSCPQLVRSRMLLEAQVIEIPVTQEAQDVGFPNAASSISRRESSQSYISDSGEERIRYVRTPSVVVSDYSDDILCGITLEEIEYFRKHRLRRSSCDPEFDSDASVASSCSNLNYCGSTLSALEGCDYQFGLRTPERKTSDCSTCSTISGDEDETYHSSGCAAEKVQQAKKKVSIKTKCPKCLHAAAQSAQTAQAAIE